LLILGQFQDLITDTLLDIGLHSEDAVQLLLLTVAVESDFGSARRQRGGGPGLGVYQIEPTTHNWLVGSYLTSLHKKLPNLKESVSKYTTAWQAQEVTDNDRYATCVARLKYLSIPHPLPRAGDVKGMAYYWKHWYNASPRGTPVEEAIRKYARYVLGADGA
jgi:hypothetical protein